MKKKMTNEERVSEWIRGARRISDNYKRWILENWEAGQVSHVEAYGEKWERFALKGGGYVVINWSDDGFVTIAN
jgi:hypothetical protein